MNAGGKHSKITGLVKSSLGKCIGIIRKVTIQNRLIISFMLISIVPILIVSIYSSIYTANTLTSKISAFSTQILNQTDKKIQSELERYEDFCIQMVFSDLVQEELLNYNPAAYSYNSKISISILQDLLGQYLTSYLRGISFLRIDTMEGDTFFDLGYDQIHESDSIRFKELADENAGYNVWGYARTVRGTNTLMMCRRIINKNNYSQNIGYFILGVSESDFSRNIFSDVDIGKGSELFIINKDGIVMSSNSPALEPGRVYHNPQIVEDIFENEKNGKNAFQSSHDNEKYLTVFTINRYGKMYQVAVIPYSYINAEASGFRESVMLFSGIFTFFVMILSYLIYKSIVNPLKGMLISTGAIASGDFNVRIYDGARDEFGYLSQRFDIAAGRVKKLIEEVKEEQKKKREAEIKMLQAQINPHFLFNTLNSLKWTATMSRADNVSESLGALAEILKNTIIDENILVPLRSEIKNIENYIIIQKIRYGNLFNTIYDIGDEFLDCRVLKFILQPIVENSIIHGFEGIDYEAELKISCYKSEDKLFIKIADNGRGFDTEALSKGANTARKNKRLSGIGIWNVQERIKLNFGDEYGLQTESAIGKGTITTVSLPYIIMKGDNNVQSNDCR